MEPMEGRWVCRRCFASNDAGASVCEQCGLERGADPAQAPVQGQEKEPAPWMPPQAQPRPQWLQLALRYAWVLLIPVVLFGGWYFGVRRDDAGQISNSGDLEVQDLRIGDCFDLKDPSASEVGEVEAKPCSQPHEYELFHAADMQGDEYPSDAAMTAFMESECLPTFGAYVGVAYEQSLLDISWYTPTSDGWDDGDHSIQCAVFDPNEAELTSSQRNATR